MSPIGPNDGSLIDQEGQVLAPPPMMFELIRAIIGSRRSTTYALGHR
jgi:hypothetical protein